MIKWKKYCIILKVPKKFEYPSFGYQKITKMSLTFALYVDIWVVVYINAVNIYTYIYIANIVAIRKKYFAYNAKETENS